MATIILVLLALTTLILASTVVYIWKNKTGGKNLSSLERLIQSRDEIIAQKDRLIEDYRNREQNNNTQIDEYRTKLGLNEHTISELRNQIAESHLNNSELTAEIARLQERLKHSEQEFLNRQQTLESLQKASTEHFKNIANEIFKAHSETFHDASQRNLRQILDPLKENIETFRKQVGEVYGNEARERFSLQKEIKSLMELNRSIGEDAQHLTKALRGDTKVQGDWGEMILERLLEMSGLQRDIHFRTQAATNTDGSRIETSDGKILRPDVVVYYPDNRCVVVDSKVSLTAYIDYINAETTEPDKIDDAAKRHITSVRRHINELSAKAYQDLVGDKKLDFIMMFIPNEGAYMTIMKLQPNIWEEAYQKRVLLTSPTHLIAALRMLEQLWKQDSATKNVQEIARLSGVMMDKFANVSKDLDNVNKYLSAALNAYNQARNRISEGNGNIISTAKRIVALGAKTSKASEINRLNSDIDDSHEQNEKIAE